MLFVTLVTMCVTLERYDKTAGRRWFQAKCNAVTLSWPNLLAYMRAHTRIGGLHIKPWYKVFTRMRNSLQLSVTSLQMAWKCLFTRQVTCNGASVTHRYKRYT